MAENNESQTLPPALTGDNYQVWAIRMKSSLEANDPWDVVKTGRDPPPLPEDPTLAQIRNRREERMKKHKAKNYIHSIVSEAIFTKIMACDTAKQAWDLLRKEFQGNDRTRQMQSLEHQKGV